MAALSRDQVLRSPLLKRQATQRLRQVERRIEALDEALRAYCTANLTRRARRAILVSIPGIGKATAFSVVIEMPELDSIENLCVVSLVALAPIARDSGQTRGERFVQGARASALGPLHASPRCQPL